MSVKNLILFSTSLICLLSCTKDVKVDIPGFEEQLVVDGRIDTDGFPIVLLSKSQDIYASTDLNAYLGSFVYDATISVSNGSTATSLQLFAIADLPLESQKRVAEMLSLEFNEIAFLPIQVYSTTDVTMKGEMGKKYTLTINWSGKTYSGTTSLLPSVSLDNLYWKADLAETNYGLCWARLSDPPNVSNAYKWEPKNITLKSDGNPKDIIFRHAGNPYFSDKFFDGLSFEFDTRYPKKDTSYLDGYEKYYKKGDTVVIRFSRIDDNVFNFFDKKEAQQQSAGNPFSTPVNAKSNISNGALGIWAGFSALYDTLYCWP